MKVFYSWSGDQSKAVAETLSVWLSQVIQAVDPWISTAIAKGSRGLEEIGGALEECRFGIVCLTRQNLASPWILFEAGALSKTRDRVWTFLLDLTPADIEPPLGSFQHTQATKSDVRKLLASINAEVAAVNEKALTESLLDVVFETNWPTLESKLSQIRKMHPDTAAPVRKDRALLEEILGAVRELQLNHEGAATREAEVIRESALKNRMMRRTRRTAAAFYTGPMSELVALKDAARADRLHAQLFSLSDQQPFVFVDTTHATAAQQMMVEATARKLGLETVNRAPTQLGAIPASHPDGGLRGPQDDEDHPGTEAPRVAVAPPKRHLP